MNSSSKYSVLLYSKYSAQSKHILDIISTSGINFGKTLNLLCVDSKAIRNRIISNKKLNIQYVPCILTVYSNGFVEKFDGPNAFNWVNEVIVQLKPPQPPPQIEQPQPQPLQPKIKPQPEVLPKKKKKNVTKIEELDDENEEEEPVVKPKRKKHLILKDKGNYESDSEDEFFSQDMPTKIDITTTSNAIKTEADNGKINIMSRAKELAKMRETDIKKPDTRSE
jgi:hypothetical protein